MVFASTLGLDLKISVVLVLHVSCKKRKGRKGVFLYSAVSSPLDCSKRFTLFLLLQTCSFRHQLGFSGKHSSHAAITCNDYSLTSPPPFIARYSFIQLSQLGHRGENENAQTLKQ